MIKLFSHAALAAVLPLLVSSNAFAAEASKLGAAVSVPEPSAGLFLVAGMIIMALRRNRF